MSLDRGHERVGLALFNLLAIGVVGTVGCEPGQGVAIGVREAHQLSDSPVSLEAAGEAHRYGQCGEGSGALALVSSGELAANLVALLADVLAGLGNLLLLSLAALTVDVTVVSGDCGGDDTDLLCGDGVQAAGYPEVPEVVAVGVVSDRLGPLDDGLGKLTVAVGQRVGPYVLVPCLGQVFRASLVPVHQGLDDVVGSGQAVAVLIDEATADEATERDGGRSPGEDPADGEGVHPAAAAPAKVVLVPERADGADEGGVGQDAGAIGIAQVVGEALASDLKLAPIGVTDDEGVIAAARSVAVLAHGACVAKLDAEVDVGSARCLVDQVEVLAVVHLCVLDGRGEAPAAEVNGRRAERVGAVACHGAPTGLIDGGVRHVAHMGEHGGVESQAASLADELGELGLQALHVLDGDKLGGGLGIGVVASEELARLVARVEGAAVGGEVAGSGGLDGHCEIRGGV